MSMTLYQLNHHRNFDGQPVSEDGDGSSSSRGTGRSSSWRGSNNNNNNNISNARPSVNDSHIMLASVNFGAMKCLTGSGFSSCDLDRGSSRRTALRALVVGLKNDEVRQFQCNVTGYQSGGGKTVVFSWETSARLQRELRLIHDV
jgi:hypothetical protein